MAAGQIEVIGGKKNFWLRSKEGFNLTHPSTPASPLIYPRIPLKTTVGSVTIDPMNLGRSSDSVGMKVVHQLLKYVIPACRKANIPVVWLNWGLTEEDIEEMPPTIVKGFAADDNFEGDRRINGLGSQIGPVQLEDGSVVDGGRVLMQDQRNSASYGPLEEKHQPQDIRIYKNRLSGFWGGTGIENVLTSRGIRTLLFAGANTDQCVGGSLQDAFTKSWDCLLLNDGCATTSPVFAKQCIEYNCEGGWGFVLSCGNFAKSVDNLQTEPGSGV